MDTLKPWILVFLTDQLRSLTEPERSGRLDGGCDYEQEVTVSAVPLKNIQVIRFRPHPILAEVSDKRHYMLAEFSESCVERFERDRGKPLTSASYPILRILEARLAFRRTDARLQIKGISFQQQAREYASGQPRSNKSVEDMPRILQNMPERAQAYLIIERVKYMTESSSPFGQPMLVDQVPNVTSLIVKLPLQRPTLKRVFANALAPASGSSTLASKDEQSNASEYENDGFESLGSESGLDVNESISFSTQAFQKQGGRARNKRKRPPGAPTGERDKQALSGRAEQTIDDFSDLEFPGNVGNVPVVQIPASVRLDRTRVTNQPSRSPAGSDHGHTSGNSSTNSISEVSRLTSKGDSYLPDVRNEPLQGFSHPAWEGMTDVSVFEATIPRDQLRVLEKQTGYTAGPSPPKPKHAPSYDKVPKDRLALEAHPPRSPTRSQKYHIEVVIPARSSQSQPLQQPKSQSQSPQRAVAATTQGGEEPALPSDDEEFPWSPTPSPDSNQLPLSVELEQLPPSSLPIRSSPPLGPLGSASGNISLSRPSTGSSRGRVIRSANGAEKPKAKPATQSISQQSSTSQQRVNKSVRKERTEVKSGCARKTAVLVDVDDEDDEDSEDSEDNFDAHFRFRGMSEEPPKAVAFLVEPHGRPLSVRYGILGSQRVNSWIESRRQQKAAGLTNEESPTYEQDEPPEDEAGSQHSPTRSPRSDADSKHDVIHSPPAGRQGMPEPDMAVRGIGPAEKAITTINPLSPGPQSALLPARSTGDLLKSDCLPEPAAPVALASVAITGNTGGNPGDVESDDDDIPSAPIIPLKPKPTLINIPQSLKSHVTKESVPLQHTEPPKVTPTKLSLADSISKAPLHDFRGEFKISTAPGKDGRDASLPGMRAHSRHVSTAPNSKPVVQVERTPYHNARGFSDTRAHTCSSPLSDDEERIPATNERLPSPDERSPSPNERSPSPSERLPSPNEQLPSPNERLPSPNERLPSPDELPHSSPNSDESLPPRQPTSFIDQSTPDSGPSPKTPSPGFLEEKQKEATDKSPKLAILKEVPKQARAKNTVPKRSAETVFGKENTLQPGKSRRPKRIKRTADFASQEIRDAPGDISSLLEDQQRQFLGLSKSAPISGHPPEFAGQECSLPIAKENKKAEKQSAPQLEKPAEKKHLVSFPEASKSSPAVWRLQGTPTNASSAPPRWGSAPGPAHSLSSRKRPNLPPITPIAYKRPRMSSSDWPKSVTAQMLETILGPSPTPSKSPSYRRISQSQASSPATTKYAQVHLDSSETDSSDVIPPKKPVTPLEDGQALYVPKSKTKTTSEVSRLGPEMYAGFRERSLEIPGMERVSERRRKELEEKRRELFGTQVELGLGKFVGKIDRQDEAEESIGRRMSGDDEWWKDGETPLQKFVKQWNELKLVRKETGRVQKGKEREQDDA